MFPRNNRLLSLTSLWRNQFNFYFEFLSIADQIKERILGQWTCVESWLLSEGSYNSHKGIYSTILEIQELLWLVKDHMWRPGDFLLFLTFFMHGMVKSFLSRKSGTHSCHWMLFDSVIAIKSVAADLFHKNNQLLHLLQHLLQILCEHHSVFFSAIMDSIPPTSRRVKSRAVRSGGRLEGWFSGDNDLIERYRFETSTKVINNPKVVCFD